MRCARTHNAVSHPAALALRSSKCYFAWTQTALHPCTSTCTSQILTSIVICIRINVLDMLCHSKWRTREVAFPMCLPTTLRILNPANLFCNMQCTTVCITAAGSRVAKRTPGTCPCGDPQRVCATKTVGPRQRGVSRRSESR